MTTLHLSARVRDAAPRSLADVWDWTPAVQAPTFSLSGKAGTNLRTRPNNLPLALRLSRLPHLIAGTAGLVCLLRPVAALGQEQDESAGDTRYRWAAKVDTSLVDRPVIPITVNAMLAWAPPNLGSHDDDAPRTGLELHVYRLGGWIRRVKQNDDGDVHLSLTATPDGAEDSCVVAEIPAVRYGTAYKQARAALIPLLEETKIKKSGRLKIPVAVELTGPAFYDGKHLKRETGPGKKSERPMQAKSHGDCNASTSALWEIHPVYKVERP
jgi:hypothetical protein